MFYVCLLTFVFLLENKNRIDQKNLRQQKWREVLWLEQKFCGNLNHT